MVSDGMTVAGTVNRRSVSGNHLGTFVHIGAAILGLSALIVTSATAFTVVKLAGAAYLVFVGGRMILGAGSASAVEPVVAPTSSGRRLFGRGFLVNVLNPKTAIFFLAFVPQFVDGRAGSQATQLLVLGLVFVGLGLLTDGLYAIAAGWAGPRLLSSPVVRRRKDQIAGAIYVTLGVTTAVAGAGE